MPNFDFHSNLSPEDFERLVRDVLEIRDAPLTFRTYRKGKDDGIDFKCNDEAEKIIGQAKLYKNDYSQLKRGLSNELIKVRRQKPSRYILATSVTLGDANIQEIINLFEGYIKTAEDIIDGEQLNKYLGQPRYKHLLKSYSKLLVPDLNMLEMFFEDVINRDIQNRTRRELAEIEQGRKVFVQCSAFEEALTRLEEDRVLIISGNPGIGKTTLAHMMVNYLIFEYGKQIDFIYCKSLDEIDRAFKPERIQVFLWDDFWGQKFDEIPSSSSYFNHFEKVIKDFTYTKPHYLIITSREYIIRKVSKVQGRNIKNVIDLNKFMLNADFYTDEDRLRILLNHIYFSGFEKEYFYNLEYSEKELDVIINHSNYTPRHIDYFIKYIYTDEYREQYGSRYTFLRDFLKYLRNPNEYWAEVFEKQSPTAQLILVILLISCDPMSLQDLKSSFLNYQEQARKVLNLAIEPLLFEQELFKLEELFIRTEEFYNIDVFVQFQSPGIKDYLLEYIRQHMNAWAEVLIPGAMFFNQLSFVFTTLDEEDDINDYDMDNPVFGNKIILDHRAKGQLKVKVLKDFGSLGYSLHRGKEFTWELDRYNTFEDVKYWNLWQLSQWFPLNLTENEGVKQFIIKQVVEDIEKYNSSGGNIRLVSSIAMEGFPLIIDLCKEFIRFDEEKLIQAYYASIASTRDFLSFRKFKNIFPATYGAFVANHIVKIRTLVRAQILEDIDEFLYDARDADLDSLIEFEIDQVFEAFEMKMTRKFEQEMEAASEWTITFGKKVRKEKAKKTNKTPKKKKKYTPLKFKAIINEYAVTKDDFDPKYFVREFYQDDKIGLKKLLTVLQSTNHLIQYYFENSESITLLHRFLPQATPINPIDLHKSIINHLLIDISDTMGLNQVNLLYTFFSELAAEIYFEETKTVTLKKVQKLFNQLVPLNLKDIQVLQSILLKRGNWYEFLNTGIMYHFFTHHVMGRTDEEYREKIMDLAGESYDGEHNLIALIDTYDPIRFKNVFAIPVLEKFINSVKANTRRGIISNYVSFFGYSYDFEWDKKSKRLKDSSASASEVATDFVIRYLFKNLNITEPDLFFCKHYFWRDNIEKFGMRKSFLDKLYRQVIETCSVEKHRFIVSGELYDCVSVDLKEFIANDDNYEAIENIGLGNYIFDLFNAIATAYDKYKLE